MPHHFEHFLIFAAIGLAFAQGYRRQLTAVTGWLLVFCGAVELVQLAVPGRHARLSDFLIDTVAAFFGIAATLVAGRLKPQNPAS